jgi:anti-sigma B factor antagonist
VTTVPFDVRAELVADGLSMIAVSGEADLYNAPTLEEHILAAVAADATRIVVDLTKVTFIDSTTITVLVRAERKLRPLNGRIALVVTDANVARVFAITALNRVFAIHATRGEAVANLSVGAASGPGSNGSPSALEDGAISSSP